MHKEQSDTTLFLATCGIVFAEVFLFLDRMTGGGLTTMLAAVAVMVVFLVLVNVFSKIKDEKVKAAISFIFAGLEVLSVFTMKGILGSIWFGIIPAVIVLVGTIQMVRKADGSNRKREKFAKKENTVPQGTAAQLEAEEEATAEAI